MSIRPAAVAGRFYPADAQELRRTIDDALSRIRVPDGEPRARAHVVPHAGYRFSGPVAAHVYARLRRDAATVNRVVLLGPSHFVRMTGFAASAHREWETPLGTVKVAEAPEVTPHPAPHEREHSLEVQVPFLQVVLPGVPIVPIAVGAAETDAIADVIDNLVNEDDVVLCSTDLSHYLDHAEAVKRDRATADSINALEPQRIRNGDACGLFPLRGALRWAARHRLTPTELDLRTSADTFGRPDRVVGYSAFSFI